VIGVQISTSIVSQCPLFIRQIVGQGSFLGILHLIHETSASDCRITVLATIMTPEDIEKQANVEPASPKKDGGVEEVSTVDPEDVEVQAIRQRNALFRALANINSRIGRLREFEARGIERVPEESRRPPKKLNASVSSIVRNHKPGAVR
jgi:hypothetical protein